MIQLLPGVALLILFILIFVREVKIDQERLGKKIAWVMNIL